MLSLVGNKNSVKARAQEEVSIHRDNLPLQCRDHLSLEGDFYTTVEIQYFIDDYFTENHDQYFRDRNLRIEYQESRLGPDSIFDLFEKYTYNHEVCKDTQIMESALKNFWSSEYYFYQKKIEWVFMRVFNEALQIQDYTSIDVILSYSSFSADFFRITEDEMNLVLVSEDFGMSGILRLRDSTYDMASIYYNTAASRGDSPAYVGTENENFDVTDYKIINQEGNASGDYETDDEDLNYDYENSSEDYYTDDEDLNLDSENASGDYYPNNDEDFSDEYVDYEDVVEEVTLYATEVTTIQAEFFSEPDTTESLPLENDGFKGSTKKLHDLSDSKEGFNQSTQLHIFKKRIIILAD